jgi:hypothetical protein
MFNKVTTITPIAMTAAAEMAMIAEILNTILLPFPWVTGLPDEGPPGLSTMGFEGPGGHATPISLPHKPSFPETSGALALTKTP